MKKVALVLGENFPRLYGGITRRLTNLLSFPCINIFCQREEDLKKLLKSKVGNSSNILDIEMLSTSGYEYSYGFVLYSSEREKREWLKTHLVDEQWFYVEEQDWSERINKRLEKLFSSDYGLVEDWIRSIVRSNFLNRFSASKENMAQFMEQDDFSLVDLDTHYNFCDYALAYQIGKVLRREKSGHFGLYYNSLYPLEYFRHMILYPSLKSCLLAVVNFKNLIYIEVDSVQRNYKSLFSLLKNKFKLNQSHLKRYILEHNSQILLVISYIRIDKGKEIVMDSYRINQILRLIEVENQLPIYTIHLISDRQRSLFNNFQFDFEEYYDQVDLQQVNRNIIRNVECGEVDIELLSADSSLPQILQIPECLDEVLSSMKQSLLGYSPVYHSKVYERVLQKYLPTKGKRKFKDSIFKQLDVGLSTQNLTEICVGNWTIGVEELQCEPLLTIYLYEQLVKDGLEKNRSKLTYCKIYYPNAYHWSSVLYLAFLMKNKDVSTFREFASWNDHQEILSLTFKHNNLFGVSTRSFLVEVAKGDPQLAEDLHKVVMRTYLVYGFYKNGADILSYIKKYMDAEKKKLFERFRIMLSTMESGTKYSFIDNSCYQELYQYYFELSEEQIGNVKKVFKVVLHEYSEWPWPSYMPEFSNFNNEEKLVLRDCFYELQSPSSERFSYEVLEQITNWYGSFCLQNGYLTDYTIMMNFLLKQIYYGAHVSSEEGRATRVLHEEMTKKVEEKLKMIQIR